MILNFFEISKMISDNFGDIVDEVMETDLNSIRVIIKDGSYLQIWRSLKLDNKYSYHWERKAIDDTIYRHDNAPHLKWKNILTFPKHFHDRSEENVTESYISNEPIEAIFEFLTFIRNSISSS
jgi:hypothetical protein